MRISDWSSDVCSSDLAPINARCTTLYGHSLGGLFVVDTLLRAPTTYRQYFASSPSLWNDNFVVLKQQPTFAERLAHSPDQLRVELSVGGLERAFPERQQIGRASCRERVCQSV